MIRYKTRTLPRYSDKWVTTWHKTHGTFNNWTTGGPFGFTCAAIRLKRSVLFIPIHDLHPDDKAVILAENPLPEKEDSVMPKEIQSE